MRLICHALVITLLALPLMSAAASLPVSLSKDPRIRQYDYDPAQVYRLDVYLRYATVIELAPSERIDTIVMGDSESWEVVRLNRGNMVSVKPTIYGAHTNMTIYTSRRSYSFDLRSKKASQGAGYINFRVGFTYPSDLKARAQAASIRANLPKDHNYFVAGKAGFRPIAIWDDGRDTYFRFPEGSRVPAIYKVDAQGNELVVNVRRTRNGAVISGVSDTWSVRIGEAEICVAHARAVKSLRNTRRINLAKGSE